MIDMNINCVECRPRVFLMDGPAMDILQRHSGKEEYFGAALEELREKADKALQEGPFSVTFKKKKPPSGDKHDYMSIGPYWWPDPDTPDGLPYIKRDGEVNPDYGNVAHCDIGGLKNMANAVRTLALAVYYIGHETYGKHAVHLLQKWFIDPGTRMNPHLQYGQAIPGINEGRGIGIVETSCLVGVVDAIELLNNYGLLTEGDYHALRSWFADYLDWLKTSSHGNQEQREINNHATGYDKQVISFALFTDQPDLALRQIQDWTMKRIDSQISADGSQPWEMVRTISLGYSSGNSLNFFHLARLAEHIGLDLWNYRTDSGRCVKQTLDFLLPYLTGEAEWPHKQIKPVDAVGKLGELLPLAIRAYDEPLYWRLYQSIEPDLHDHESQLVFPGFLLDRNKKVNCAPG